MISDGVEQRSLEWYRSRIGYITGSRVYDLMKVGKGEKEWSDTAKAYLYQVAGERLFNKSFLDDDTIFQDYIDQVSISSKAIQWGIDMEEQAKSCFLQLNPNAELSELSSCKHDSIPFFSASPDGAVLTRDDGRIRVIEVKCPSVKTYMKYKSCISDTSSLKFVEPKYYWQMQAEMACTGLNGGIFIAYCPWLSEPIHTVLIERSKEDIECMEERVKSANVFIGDILNQ